MRRTVDILGVPIDNLSMRDALQRAESFIDAGFPHQITTPNSIIVVKAQHDLELRECLKEAHLSIPDGIGLVWGSKYIKDPLVERVTGIDFMLNMINRADKKGYKIFFLGGKPGISEMASQNLKEIYPQLEITCQHGYFTAEEEIEVIKQINEVKPHILFVGMGAVKQELWIRRNLSQLGVPVCMGVGGSFDVTAGRLKRAPVKFQEWGLEWLHRFYQEPWRSYQLVYLLKFSTLILKQRFIRQKSHDEETAATRINILGVPVDALTSEQIISQVRKNIALSAKTFIVAINPEKIMKAQQDPHLLSQINQADICIPDGIGLLWAGKILGRPIPARVTGIDLMVAFLKMAAANNYRVFFLGGKPGVAAEAARVCEKTYPGLKVAGTHHGYYPQEEEKEIIDRIVEVKPDILFVAMGSPRQEHWILAKQSLIKVPLCMGVGGSLDVITGRLPRAPLWMQNSGLEWSFRLLKEPWRIRRMLVLPQYMFCVLKARFSDRHRNIR